MPEHVIIDGNNLLHAMRAYAPLPALGRETLVRVVELWARQGDSDVTLVFDGPVPRRGLARQMSSSRIIVRFSAPLTADDVIVDMVRRTSDPGRIRVVTSDTAIRREARYRRCRHSDSASFVAELCLRSGNRAKTPSSRSDKPGDVVPEDLRKWLQQFGYDDTETDPFDGYDAMLQ